MRRPDPVLASVKQKTHNEQTNGARLDRGPVVGYYVLGLTRGATGGGTTGATAARQGATALGSIAALAHCREQRYGALGVGSVALNTQHGLIGLAESAQDLKPALTVATLILVKRHHVLLCSNTTSIQNLAAVVKSWPCQLRKGEHLGRVSLQGAQSRGDEGCKLR